MRSRLQYHNLLALEPNLRSAGRALRAPFFVNSACLRTASPLASMYSAGNQIFSLLFLPFCYLYKFALKFRTFLVEVRDLPNFVHPLPPRNFLNFLTPVPNFAEMLKLHFTQLLPRCLRNRKLRSGGWRFPLAPASQPLPSVSYPRTPR